MSAGAAAAAFDLDLAVAGFVTGSPFCDLLPEPCDLLLGFVTCSLRLPFRSRLPSSFCPSP